MIFNKPNYLFLLLALTTISSNILSKPKFERNIDDFVLMLNKKMTQIEKRYAQELAAADLDCEKMMLIVTKQAYKDYWFFALTSYSNAIAFQIKTLNKFKKGKILSNQTNLANNQALADTLTRLESLQAKLTKINDRLKQEPAFVSQYKISNIISIGLGVLAISALIAGGLYLIVIGTVWLTAATLSTNIVIQAFQPFIAIAGIGAISSGILSTSIGMATIPKTNQLIQDYNAFENKNN